MHSIEAKKFIQMYDIRQLSQSTKGKYVRNWWSGGDKLKRLYAVTINGNFGAASVRFDDQGKCEEVYSAIRQMNRMGDPIFMS